MKRLLVALLLAFLCLLASAQGGVRRISGRIIEEDTLLPVIQGAVQILNAADSSAINGTMTDQDGRFSIVVGEGDLIVKISMLGFQTKHINIHKAAAGDELALGNQTLAPDSQLLRSSNVSAKAPIATVIADTVVYNPAAFRLAEDAMLEDLLKKIPGLEINGNTVMLHGKRVTQLYVNGKRFFGGDVGNGLKSLPADMVDKVNAYERESDFARLSGIDDGEREPTLDIKIRKDKMKGWHNNLNVGAGTQGRYTARLNANKMEKKNQSTIILRAWNNYGQVDLNTTSRTQIGTGGTGDRHGRQAGYTFARNYKNLELNGHFHYDGNGRDVSYRRRAEYIYPSSHYFTCTNGTEDAYNNALKGDLILEWRPTKQLTVYVKPDFVLNYNKTLSGTFSNYLTKDPSLWDIDPNDYVNFYEPGSVIPDSDSLKSVRNYSTNNLSDTHTRIAKQQIVAQVTYRSASKRGRSITFRTQDWASINESDQFLSYLTRYYKIKKNYDSLLVKKFYQDGITGFISASGQISYNEPLGKGNHIQATLRTEHRINNTSKDLFNFSQAFPEWLPTGHTWRKDEKAALPAGYSDYLIDQFSYDGRYDYWSTSCILNFRHFKKKFNYTVGVTLKPQQTRLSYTRDGIDYRIEKSIFTVFPNFNLKYRPKKSTQLSLNYSCWANTPSLYDLMPVESGNNPLYVHTGNPDLLPPQVHNATLSFNSSNIRKQNSLIANFGFRLIQDQISTSTVLDPESGVRTTQSVNVDGNWRANGSIVFNQTLRDNRFSFSSHTSGEYQNNVSLLYNTKLKEDETNVASRLMVKEQFDGCYRNDWLELTLRGRGEYTKEHSELRPDMDQEPLLFAAGFESVVTFPWKMRLTSEFTTLFQRGFTYNELNRNYYVLNLGLAQPLFKKKATIRVDAYDILGQLENITRSFSVQNRTITSYNGIDSFVMVRFIYRFQVK